MTLLFWIVRLLVLFLIIRLVVLMVRSALVAAGGGSDGPARGGTRVKRSERLGGTLVQDPQCGTYLPEDRAIALRVGGTTHHFCSTACRDAWQGSGGRVG